MALPVPYMEIKLRFGLIESGGGHYEDGVICVGRSAWDTIAGAASVDARTLPNKRASLELVVHEAIHAFFPQRGSPGSAVEKLSQDVYLYVLNNFAFGGLQRLPDGPKLATQITDETLAFQGAHWVATYFECAHRLATSDDPGATINWYVAAMAEKRGGYYNMIGVPRPTKLKLSDALLARYRDVLIPGITGRASDVRRLLRSPWATGNVTAERRARAEAALDRVPGSAEALDASGRRRSRSAREADLFLADLLGA
jgi:hypothetical protein